MDTNVVISGLIFSKGPPGKIVDMWIDNKIEALLSQRLIEECLDVLMRPKFDKINTLSERQDLFAMLMDLENTIFVDPGISFEVIKEDPEDNYVLECAVGGKAEFIVSGDHHLQSLGEFQGIPVVSPAKFIEIRG